MRREVAVLAGPPALLPQAVKQMVPALGTRALLGFPSFQLASAEVAATEVPTKGWGRGWGWECR